MLVERGLGSGYKKNIRLVKQNGKPKTICEQEPWIGDSVVHAVEVGPDNLPIPLQQRTMKEDLESASRASE